MDETAKIAASNGCEKLGWRGAGVELIKEIIETANSCLPKLIKNLRFIFEGL